MLKSTMVKTALVAGLLVSQLSAVENNFIMDIMPGAYQGHSNADGFANSISTSSSYSYSYGSETISGQGSISPSIALGYGLDVPYASFDVTVGAGYLINGAFTAAYTQGEVTAYVTTGKKGFMIGPFYRYVNYSNPTWATDNLTMEGTTASAYGISMMTGGKKVKFKLKVVSLNGADIAVKGANGYTPSSDTISLDGVGVELGLALRF
jgi:hypothetical protein